MCVGVGVGVGELASCLLGGWVDGFWERNVCVCVYGMRLNEV